MYASALNFLCGFTEPGLHRTWPRSTASLSMPRSRQPTLSPATPSSSSLRNISTPAPESTTVAARHTLVQQLAEHLHPGHDRLLGVAQPDDLHFLADLDLAALDPPGHNSAAARDREHVLDRHQERLVDRALRQRHVRVQRLVQPQDRLVRGLPLLAVERLDRR